MKSLFFVFILSLVVACSSSDNKNRKINGSFNKEIGARIKLLNKDSIQSDSLKVNPNGVDSIVNTLILLSKDIENMNACATKSNQYFEELSTRFGISSHEFIKIKVGMHVDDVGTALKDNELKFFNMILLKNNKGDLLLQAAQ